MAVYSVEGKLGTGKTKFAVWQAQRALRQGRRVASNVDLNLGVLTPERHSWYIRIPDKPTAEDLDAIGHGNPESYDEERNGVLILDELGTWLNARNFSDKGRMPVIDWLIHARKLGWDVYLIVQNANMIDRQVREALIEYQCRCIRLDKVKIPGLGGLLGLFNDKWGYMPRMHLVTARVGEGANAVIAERWFYRGDDLHAAYDTRQIFTASYPHGAHCVLPSVPAPQRKALWSLLRAVFSMPSDSPTPRIAPRAKLRVVELLMGLPEDERLRHWRRLEALGLLEAASRS